MPIKPKRRALASGDVDGERELLLIGPLLRKDQVREPPAAFGLIAEPMKTPRTSIARLPAFA